MRQPPKGVRHRDVSNKNLSGTNFCVSSRKEASFKAPRLCSIKNPQNV